MITIPSLGFERVPTYRDDTINKIRATLNEFYSLCIHLYYRLRAELDLVLKFVALQLRSDTRLVLRVQLLPVKRLWL